MIAPLLRVGLLLACGMTVASHASAQDSRLRERIPAAALGTIEALLDSARVVGVPIEPLVDRALEGASKGATADRIVVAVQRLAGELRRARAALGGASSEAEIVAGASALRAGATGENLALLRQRRASESLLVPVAVLADLVAVGVPIDTAVAAVTVLADGFDDTQYIAFRRNVERDIGLGASPVTAVGVRLEAATDFTNTSGSPRTPPKPRKP